MKRIAALVLLCLCLSSCITPPVAKGKGETWITKINKVCIKSIDFYSDKNFSELEKPHWYMDEIRKQLNFLVEKKLPEYGFELVDCTDNNKELHIQADLCVMPGLIVALYCRARVYYQDKLLCEISGNAVSPANKEAIIKAQDKLADKLIAIFAAKIQHRK